MVLFAQVLAFCILTLWLKKKKIQIMRCLARHIGCHNFCSSRSRQQELGSERCRHLQSSKPAAAGKLVLIDHPLVYSMYSLDLFVYIDGMQEFYFNFKMLIVMSSFEYHDSSS